MKIDTTLTGILKSLVYVVVCSYEWINSKGIDAYVFTVLLTLMSLDMILSWFKSSRVSDLENPTSKVAKKGIVTKAIIFVIPAVVGLIWGIFDKENALKVVNTLLIALAIAEGYSCIANGYMIRTGELLSEYDAVSYVFKKTAEKIKSLLEKILN